MPKLDFKVEKRLFEFLKIQLYMGTMTNDVGNGSTMTQKMLLGLLVISKKNFNPYLAFFACTKKDIKTCSHAQNGEKSEFSHLYKRMCQSVCLSVRWFVPHFFKISLHTPTH